MQDLIYFSKEQLKEAFQEWASENRPQPSTDWMTVRGLSEYLGYSTHWVYRQISNKNKGNSHNLPPVHRQGKKVLFNKTEVDKWMEGGKS